MKSSFPEMASDFALILKSELLPLVPPTLAIELAGVGMKKYKSGTSVTLGEPII